MKTSTLADAVQLLDLEPTTEDLASEAVAGLRKRPRELPCKFFYDARGSELFDRICELPEYYPTRTEMAILRSCVDEIAAILGPEVLLSEFGSGSSLKTRILLDRLKRPAGYVPIDISRRPLLRSARSLALAYPHVPILPVCADYGQAFDLPEPLRRVRRRAAFFPGSTIGNFPPDEARAFLDRIARMLGPGGLLLIGVDLRKSPDVLIPAYNDASGVTAEFNLNLLVRMNREAGADFRTSQWRHEAIWNEGEGCIEMRLFSRTRQTVRVGGESFTFAPGEFIRTEYSYKRTPEGFAALAERFDVDRIWQDRHGLFSVQLLAVR